MRTEIIQNRLISKAFFGQNNICVKCGFHYKTIRFIISFVIFNSIANALKINKTIELKPESCNFIIFNAFEA